MAVTMPLKDLCTIDITDGTHKTPTYADEGYIFLSSKNVTSGVIDWDNVMYIPASLHNELYKRIAPQKNDILLAKNGTTGVAAIVDRDEVFDIYVSLALIRPDETKVLPRYLLHAINSYPTKQFFDSHLKGIGVPNLHLTHIRETPIRVPSFTEQKQITDVLDKVDELIALRKEQLAKLDQLVKSRFIELFGDPITNPMGWKLHRFDSLCENLDSRRKPITASEREAGIYPYYGASGIVDYVAGYLFDEDILLISEDGANLLMRSTPIAFSVSGKVWVNNHAHVVRFEKMSMQKYIEVFFSLIDISDHITGSAQPKLNQAKLNAMMFPVPSMERLDAFSQFIEQIDKSKLAIQQSLDKLELLKKSLMQEYFGQKINRTGAL